MSRRREKITSSKYIQGCSNKVAYANIIIAELVAAKIPKKPGNSHKAHAYFCEHCHCWHVGHSSEGAKEREKQRRANESQNSIE